MALQFQPVTLEYQDEYIERLHTCREQASDYSFVNIFGWRDVYGMQWAFDDRLVWLRQTVPDVAYWAPVGPWGRMDWTSCELPADAKHFTRVPRPLAERWETELGASIAEARHHHDYVYDVEELVDLKGNRFHKKKNLFNQFRKKYEYEYRTMTTECVEAALKLQSDWCGWRDCESESTLEAENSAVFEMLSNWDVLHDITGGSLYADGIMVAFTVAEPVSDKMMVIHVEKGRGEYKGVYQAINKLFLENDAAGREFVNREQDLGDPGLRKAKESYHPTYLLEKFEVDLPR